MCLEIILGNCRKKKSLKVPKRQTNARSPTKDTPFAKQAKTYSERSTGIDWKITAFFPEVKLRQSLKKNQTTINDKYDIRDKKQQTVLANSSNQTARP